MAGAAGMIDPHNTVVADFEYRGEGTACTAPIQSRQGLRAGIRTPGSRQASVANRTQAMAIRLSAGKIRPGTSRAHLVWSLLPRGLQATRTLVHTGHYRQLHRCTGTNEDIALGPQNFAAPGFPGHTQAADHTGSAGHAGAIMNRSGWRRY